MAETANLSNESRVKKPLQARSIATFTQILEAASAILAEKGIQALNTNLVAETAGVNIGTVYHYFPDKTAILVELFRRDQERRSLKVRAELESLLTTDDLEAWGKSVIEAARSLRSEFPEAVPLRRAFRSVPELVILDKEDTEESVAFFANILCQRFPHLSRARAELSSQLIFSVAATLLDNAVGDAQNEDLLIEEGTRMLYLYFLSVTK